MSSSFDKYGESYDDVMKQSIGFLGKKHDFYTRVKAKSLLTQLGQLYGSTKDLHVLDVGCGVGKTDAFLFSEFAQLYGVDISRASVERAQCENPQVRYKAYDGRSLPFQDAVFDAAFLICVLHHVEPEDRVSLLCEVKRTLRPGGTVFIFEHNPFHPLARFAVARCEFDRDARLLSRRESRVLLDKAGFGALDSQYLLYLPFETPFLTAPGFWKRNIPLGAQYFTSGVAHVEKSI